MEHVVKKLNRFTSLPILLDLLQRKKLTLLNPKTWEDQNDAQVLLEYIKKKKLKEIFAICLSFGDETIHHWKSYSGGSSGCLIEFNAKKLLSFVDKVPHTIHRKVEYRRLRDSPRWKPNTTIDDIPFIKRWAYRYEEEYRIIALPPTQSDFFEIDISLEVIEKITISQQMPKQIYQTIKGYLSGLRGDPESKINRSSLFENRRWINTLIDIDTQKK